MLLTTGLFLLFLPRASHLDRGTGSSGETEV